MNFKNSYIKYAICILFFVTAFTGAVYIFYKPQTRIDMGINALSNMVKKNGRITYEIDFLENKKSKTNNIVREMGSAYALAFSYNQTQNEKLKKQLKKILSKMEKRCVSFQQDTCYISENGKKIKIGATALALLAEMYYEQTSKDFSYAKLRNEMLNALRHSYREGKGVITSPKSDKTSPYFDGETWFALAVYNMFYPNDTQISELLNSLDETMFKIYKDQYLISFVHWGTMAASHRFEVTKDKKFIDFLKTQFELYIQNAPQPAKGSSTCSVTEGLSDTVYFLAEKDPEFAQKVLSRINENREKIYNLQVMSKEITGKHAEKFKKIHPETEKYMGAFKNTPNSYQTRNDITQHCLIALLKHKRATHKMH